MSDIYIFAAAFAAAIASILASSSVLIRLSKACEIAWNFSLASSWLWGCLSGCHFLARFLYARLTSACKAYILISEPE